MLSRIFAIIRREYLERVRTKAFWISTLIVPVFLGGIIIIPSWLAMRGGGTFNVAVLDLSGHFEQSVAEEISHMLSSNKEKLVINLKPIEPGPDPAATRERVKNAVQAQKYDGMLVLPATLPASGQPEYVAPNVAAFKLLSVLERSVNNAVVAARLTGAGLDAAQVRELTKRVGLKTLKLGAKGQETRDQGQGFLLSYAFLLIIYMSVLMYGMYVMRGVLEEKMSRIVEVVIATVKPFELMLGKIIGIGAVGLTQFLIWGLVMMAITVPGAAAAIGFSGLEMPSFPPLLMVFFVIFFILGFLLFGTLYAGIGAAFDTEQEAQNFQFVVMVPLLMAFLLMFLVMNQPDSTLSTVLSLVPFFTPMLMFLRMTLVQVPVLEVAASLVLMMASIVGAAWVVGKIYRVGILMHGSKPKMKDLVRWIREA